MNSREIENLLRTNSDTRHWFRGVYARNRLPTRNNKLYPSAFVVNTDRNDQPGEHWVAFYFDENGHGEYFDSYGFPPFHKEFISFLKSYSVKRSTWTHNTIALQCTTSKVCGHYCIMYVYFRCKGYTLSEFVSLFDTDVQSNDVLVKDLLELLI